MLGYIVKMINLYNMESKPAYWQSVGDGCFQFTSDLKKASILTKNEADEVMKHKESYCKMYAAENMEVIDLLNNPIPVNFKINGRETSDVELIIGIPDEYRDLFEGHNFKNHEQLSKALMFANCAHEGLMNNRPWVTAQNEHSLKSILKKEC